MSAHLSEVAIVGFLDGALAVQDAAAVSAHLDGCGDCRRRLALLSVFDEFVQANRPEEDATTSAMFDVSQRLLAGAPAQRSFRFPLLLAALLLIGSAVAFGIWRGGADGALDVRIVRYAVVEATRGTAPVRFHLDATMPAAAFAIVFARLPGGDVVQLLTEAESAAVGPGAVRLPGDALLDWEYDADAMPRELLVVLAPIAPSRDRIAQLRTAWAAQPIGMAPPQSIADGLTVRIIPFPS